MGVVFPGGVGRVAFAETLTRGEPLARPSRSRPGILAAELPESLKPLVERKGLTALSRGALLAAAAIENLAAAEPWVLAESSRADCALVVGTAFGHLESRADFHREARHDGVRFVSPILFPNTIINSLAGHAAILYGLRGPNSTVTSGRRSGLEAILRAATLLAAGRAPRAIVVGCDEVSRTLLHGLHALEDAQAGSTIVPGEAAAALLMEPESSAPASPCLGRLLGAAERSSVRIGIRQAIVEAMEAALADAGLEARAISRLHLSGRFGGGLGTAEAEAARDVFGSQTPRAFVQEVFGETFGTQGVLAAAATLVGEEGLSLVSSVDTMGATCAVLGRQRSY